MQLFATLPWLLTRESSEATILQLNNLIKEVTHIIITTHFSDHLDLDSLQLFRTNTPIYTTYGSSKILKKNGFTNIIIDKPGSIYQLGSLNLEIFRAGPLSNYSLRIYY